MTNETNIDFERFAKDKGWSIKSIKTGLTCAYTDHRTAFAWRGWQAATEEANKKHDAAKSHKRKILEIVSLETGDPLTEQERKELIKGAMICLIDDDEKLSNLGILLTRYENSIVEANHNFAELTKFYEEAMTQIGRFEEANHQREAEIELLKTQLAAAYEQVGTERINSIKQLYETANRQHHTCPTCNGIGKYGIPGICCELCNGKGYLQSDNSQRPSITILCAGKHGENPQVKDCPMCMQEELEDLRTKLANRQRVLGSPHARLHRILEELEKRFPFPNPFDSTKTPEEYALEAIDTLIANRQAEIVQEPVGYYYKYLNAVGLEVWVLGDARWGDREPIESKPVFLIPPSAEALVAAAYQKAASIEEEACRLIQFETKYKGASVKDVILALTPQDAQQALDDLLRKAAIGGLQAGDCIFYDDKDIDAIIAKAKGKS